MSLRSLPELESRIAALEPLRRHTGLSRTMRLALAAAFGGGGLLLGVVGMFVVSDLLFPVPDNVEPGTPVPVSRRESLASMAAFLIPALTGGALAAYTALRVRSGASPAEYRQRFAREVVSPVVLDVLPDAKIDIDERVPAAWLDASRAFHAPVHPTLSRARLHLTWDVARVPARAVAASVLSANEQRAHRRSNFFPELVDGLIVHFDRPHLVRSMLVVGDARLYPRLRELAPQPVPVSDARFRLMPSRIGMAAEVLSVGLSQFASESGLMFAAHDPAAVTHSISDSLRDALVRIAELVHGPFLLVFTPEGVTLRLDGRGRLRPFDAADQLDEVLGTGTGDPVRLMASALQEDARLLAVLPDVTRAIAGIR
jgi:hypothetical protein